MIPATSAPTQKLMLKYFLRGLLFIQRVAYSAAALPAALEK